MSTSALIVVGHQVLFQGMFVAKNVALRRKLGVPVRGRNREANRAIAFLGLFLVASVTLALFDTPVGTIRVVSSTTARVVALVLLAINLLVAAASLWGMRDSWRVGIREDQRTELVQTGIYRFTRNPYFLSYMILLVAYSILLQNVILLALSLVGFGLIHAMVLREERHLVAAHGEAYRRYRERVPRYFLV